MGAWLHAPSALVQFKRRPLSYRQQYDYDDDEKNISIKKKSVCCVHTGRYVKQSVACAATLHKRPTRYGRESRTEGTHSAIRGKKRSQREEREGAKALGLVGFNSPYVITRYERFW